MKYSGIMGIMFMLCMGLAFQAGAEPTLAIDPVTVRQGGSATLHLRLSDSTDPYAGVNATLELPAGVTVTGASALDGFTLEHTDPPGTPYTLIIYSHENTFSDGLLASLHVEAAADADSIAYSDLFSASALSKGDIAAPLAMSVTPGTGGTITIQINNLPVFDFTQLPDGHQDELYAFVVTASDADNDLLNYSAPGLPDWLSLTPDYSNSATSVIQCSETPCDYWQDRTVETQTFTPYGIAIDKHGNRPCSPPR